MEICIKWNVCRICLDEESPTVKMNPIYEDTKLASEIFDCSGIQLKQTDNLPEKICKKCLITLKYAMKFRVTCRKSTDYLQSILIKTQSASSIFKSAKTEEDEMPFECIDFLEEEPPAEVENIVDHGELHYIIEDSDGLNSENVSVKNSEAGECQENEEEIIYLSESEIKQEVYEINKDDLDTQSQSDKADQVDEYIVNELVTDESITRTSDNDQKYNMRPYVKKETKNPVEFICDVCGNHFHKRGLLNFHMKMHRNEKNYVCELCSKRFNSPCNLRAHIRVHTGEKPFQCQFCDRKFADRSTQIKHERIHTNEKPYHCATCGKAFSLSTSLKAHEKVHTGEKPFKCEPCAKAFTLPHQLKAHLLTNMHSVLSKLEQ